MPQDRIAGCVFDSRGHGPAKAPLLLLGAALAALLLCTNPPAARAGDDNFGNDDSFTKKFLQTLGVRDPNEVEYEINYSERSPLVVPPNRNLPPPITAGVAPVPNWPKDPDAIKRKAAKDNDKPVPGHGDNVIESARTLRPDELNVRASPSVAAPGTSEQSTPSQLGQKKASLFNMDWLKKEEYGTFTGEPTRASLTDPPPGYQTPSPDQPYGITDGKQKYKVPTVGDRMEPSH
jgi:hypothetical protein